MRGKLFHQWDPVIIWGLQQYKACLKVWSSRERWGTHSCVMEQHRLMKQQTTIMWQRGSRLRYKGMCGDSLPLAPLPTSLLISLFPRFVHTPCLLQAKAVKCMHRKRAAHYFLTEKKKNPSLLWYRTLLLQNNAQGKQKIRRHFSFVADG